jgi:hypothetical protein
MAGFCETVTNPRIPQMQVIFLQLRNYQMLKDYLPQECIYLFLY